MKKFFAGLGIFLVVLVASVFIFRAQIFAFLEPRITANMYVEEVTDTYDPDLAVGAQFPKINAIYAGDVIDSIDQFAGENGTFFIANRSADWCPYCRSQLGQLQDYVDEFAAAGIGLVAITYDTPEKQQPFIDAVPITYPFLADIDASTVTTLGILNEDYEPGTRAYGVPHPGVFILDAEGVVVGKIFVDGYETRVTAEASLKYAKAVLGLE